MPDKKSPSSKPSPKGKEPISTPKSPSSPNEPPSSPQSSLSPSKGKEPAASSSKGKEPATASASSSTPASPSIGKAEKFKASPRNRSPDNVVAVEEERPGMIDGQIEVDSDAYESGIDMGSVVTDTSSLRDSILAYKWSHGRRYHAYEDGAYYGPNDERQQQAEDLMHEMFTIVLDQKLSCAPLPPNVQKVLDLGTGTGQWAVDFADAYPAAQVIGTDLSPIQPSFVPPNCKFEIDDFTKPWTYPPSSFDLIHARALTGCVSSWPEFYKEAFMALRPGGILEHLELFGIAKSDDGTLRETSPLVRWVEEFRKIGDVMGKTFFFAEDIEGWMQEAGFTTEYKVVKVPLGPWPKDPTMKLWGMWNRQFLIMGLEGFALRGLTDLLGYTVEEAEVFIAEVRKQFHDNTIHLYVDMVFCYGVKPA